MKPLFVFFSLLASSSEFADAQPDFKCTFVPSHWDGAPDETEVYRLPGGRYGSDYGTLLRQKDEGGFEIWANANGVSGAYPRLVISKTDSQTAEFIVLGDNEQTKTFFCKASP